MKSVRFRQLGLVVSGLAAAAFVGAGCTPAANTNNNNTNTDAGQTTDSGPVTHLDAGTHTDAGTHADAGPQIPNNHTFETATPTVVDPAALIAGQLVDANLTVNYYSFMGTKGDRLTILATAQGLITTSTDLHDPTVIDTVVTLFDATHAQIAQDDDEWPNYSTDSVLDADLPATGQYFVSVSACATAFGPNSCAPPSGVKTFKYELGIFHTKGPDLSFHESNAGTTNTTTATAAPVTFTADPLMAGSFLPAVLDGNFQSLTDTQVFSFTPPATEPVTAGVINRTDIYVQPIGPANGDGSTSNAKFWITDSTGTNVLGSVDQTNYKDGDNAANGPIDMAVPVTLGQQYYLFVQNAATTSTPTTDYYFAEQAVGSDTQGASAETENGTQTLVDDTLATAQNLVTPTGFNPGFYSVAGTLSSATDVDFYEVDRTGTLGGTISCQAKRAGSGVLGLTVGLYTADANMMPVAVSGASGTEAADSDFVIGGQASIPISGTDTKIYLKVSATSQDATVAGNYYYCQVFFQ